MGVDEQRQGDEGLDMAELNPLRVDGHGPFQQLFPLVFPDYAEIGQFGDKAEGIDGEPVAFFPVHGPYARGGSYGGGKKILRMSLDQRLYEGQRRVRLV